MNDVIRLVLTSAIVLLGTIPLSVCQRYEDCSRTTECGDIREIRYPFWGEGRPEYCGYPGFEINCRDSNTLLITISSVNYRVLQIDNSNLTIRVSRDDFSDTLCPTSLVNTTLDFTIFDFSRISNDQNISLFYGCRLAGGQLPVPLTPSFPYEFDCGGGDSLNTFFTREFSPGPGVSNAFNLSCETTVIVPVNRTAARVLGDARTASSSALEEAIDSGFSIQWSADNVYCGNCVGSGGACGRDLDSGSFDCYCRDGTQCYIPPRTEGGNNSRNLSLNIGLPIAGAVIAGVGLGWLLFYLRQRKKKRHLLLGSQLTQTTASKETTTPMSSKPLSMPPSGFSRNIPSLTTAKSDLSQESTYFGVQVFNYSELEEATDNFNPSRTLGDGGFGTVYYGMLSDGRIVAVKRLYENSFKRVEQFMNEVQILTRLRHENLVKLYGCTSKRSQELLLVYEYISNGTVADHLHGKQSGPGLLSWSIRLNIAIETAEALNYLHKSDIIHRDVKTNNILLDDDFHVKVADFGLSRLFPNNVTHVSTAPQGTPGYVDPEYYQCYQLTEKSDVYSFGVVLFELISSLQAVDTNRHRHNINLANMAVNKIQNRDLHELVDSGLGYETDFVVRRMTTLVAELAFRCLLQERDMRPSMEEVLEGLKGIRNEGLNGEKAEVVDIFLVNDDDETGPLKGSFGPPTPDSTATEKWASGSAPNSSG